MNYEQAANLEKLADFLEHNPEVHRRFNMENFISDEPHCGSAGCALGWAPVALGHWNDLPAFNIQGGLDNIGVTRFTDFSDRYFGTHCSTPFWDWMFSGEWGRIDNTPEGAARRIHLLLEGNHDMEIEDFVREYLEEAETDDAIERYEEMLP